MKKFSTVFLLLNMIVFGNFRADAQNFSSDLRAMQSAYENAQSFQLEMKVFTGSFQLNRSNGEFDKVEIMRKGKLWYSKFSGGERLIGKKQYIQVIEDDELVLVSPLTRKTRPQGLLYWGNWLQLADSAKSIELLEEKKGQRTYRIEISQGMVESIEISFDTNSKFLKKIVYFYNSQLNIAASKSTIEFSSMNTHPDFPFGTFQEDRFITGKKDKQRPVGLISDYTILCKN